jgi:hypothetical protein
MDSMHVIATTGNVTTSVQMKMVNQKEHGAKDLGPLFHQLSVLLHMILKVFDFDHTLVNTPTNTPENVAKYESATGIPWLVDKELAAQLTEKLQRPIGVRKGWFGRPETLEPPLVPDPAPPELFIPKICKLFLESKLLPNTITIVLTGRHLGLKRHVLRILDDGNVIKCERQIDQQGRMWIENADVNLTEVYCLGQDGPFMTGAPTKPPDTLPWKIWIINQYLKNYDIELIEMWEDRYAHMTAFYNAFPETDTIVHYVPDIVEEEICTRNSQTEPEE